MTTCIMRPYRTSPVRVTHSRTLAHRGVLLLDELTRDNCQAFRPYFHHRGEKRSGWRYHDVDDAVDAVDCGDQVPDLDGYRDVSNADIISIEPVHTKERQTVRPDRTPATPTTLSLPVASAHWIQRSHRRAAPVGKRSPPMSANFSL
jgi:hypothetical protein